MVFVSTFRRALFAHSAPATYLARGQRWAAAAHSSASPILEPASTLSREVPRHAPPLHGRWEQSALSGALSLRWYAPEPV